MFAYSFHYDKASYHKSILPCFDHLVQGSISCKDAINTYQYSTPILYIRTGIKKMVRFKNFVQVGGGGGVAY